MAKKNIESRTDAVTRDISAEATPIKREYRFPTLGVTVKAASYQEALQEAKKQVKK